jgi:hypothetical protein
MHARISANHPLRRLFRGLVENVFMAELGVCNTQLTTYLSDLLAAFIHMDVIYRLRGVDGETIYELSRMEAEAHLGPCVDDETRTRTVNLYIGDFTLFWTGVYPEQLRPRHSGVDRLREYLLHGKRSYGIASELGGSQARPPAELLRQLSTEFEHCAHGLQRVRELWGRDEFVGREA